MFVTCTALGIVQSGRGKLARANFKNFLEVDLNFCRQYAANRNRMQGCRIMKMGLKWLLVLAVSGMTAASAFAAETAKPQAVVTKLLESSLTVDGKPVVYPSGAPAITVRIVELPPGGETGRHRHPIPLVAYILEGEVAVYEDGAPAKRYKTGESFVETTGWHNGINEGTVPVRILATYLGVTGASLAVKPEAVQ